MEEVKRKGKTAQTESNTETGRKEIRIVNKESHSTVNSPDGYADSVKGSNQKLKKKKREEVKRVRV